MRKAVKSYLAMNPKKDFKPSFPVIDGLSVARVEHCTPDFYRFLYTGVGKPYGWTDRLPWSDEQLNRYLSKKNLSIHVALLNGSVAGYVELLRKKNETQVAYFGLMKRFHGKGIGKYLLSYGIREAVREKAKVVTVTTLTTDGKHALANYMKRGFRLVKEKNVLI